MSNCLKNLNLTFGILYRKSIEILQVQPGIQYAKRQSKRYSIKKPQSDVWHTVYRIFEWIDSIKI